MARGESLVNLMLAVIVAFVILYIGIGILGTASDTDGSFTKDFVRLSGDGTWVDIEKHRSGENETVFDSRGNAVHLTGADDSHVTSQQSFEIASDDNWTVSTWAMVNSSAANENMTAVSLNGRVLIQYNGSQGNWSVWYFDDGTTDSWRANVSAPNQPGNFSLITAQHNGTHLTIHRNQTQGDVVNTSAGDNIEPVWVNSTNWHGRLEETRTFDANISDSERNTLFNNPIQPVTNNRTARIYYDRGRGDVVLLFHAPGNLDLSNGTWVDGLDGSTMTRGTDYNWDSEGPRLRPISGGGLSDQPVAWVDYDQFDEATSYAITVMRTYDFASMVPTIIFALFALFLITQYREDE